MQSFVRVCFFLLAVFFSFNVHAQIDACQKQHCLTVVDAGSSGSRLHIYSYDLDNSKTPINIKEQYSKKVKPGLSTLDANQETVNAYLTQLFVGSPETSLPVYFYATAGMRLLPQAQQQKMYGYLHDWFNNQSNWQLKEAKTISGSDEGLYGWLAVNYQLGNLTNNGRETVGVMDMGGASVQISFSVSNNSIANTEDLKEFDLYGRHYSLFIHSFLGLGQTEMSHQFLDSSSCFANGYSTPDNFKGQGDAVACENEISPLMNDIHKVNQLVQPVIKENKVKTWYALGGVVDLIKSSPFNFTANQFTEGELLSKANSAICQQDWNSLTAQYPGNDFLYGYCMFPAYYYALMVDGYGLSAQQPINYMPANLSGDWTLGVILSQKS